MLLRQAIAALGAATIIFATAPLAAQQPATEQLSGRAASIVGAWRAAIQRVRDQQETMGTVKGVSDALRRRAALDQVSREEAKRAEAVDLPQAEAELVETQIWLAITAMDEDNTRFLRANLPKDGWFRIERDGRETAHDAWLLLQHSPDRDFQRYVLVQLEPLIAKGEVEAADYARLYDRVEALAGRPQRYGSQANCKGGVKTLIPLEDASQVDVRRRAIGLTETLAAYKARLGVGGPC